MEVRGSEGLGKGTSRKEKGGSYIRERELVGKRKRIVCKGKGDCRKEKGGSYVGERIFVGKRKGDRI